MSKLIKFDKVTAATWQSTFLRHRIAQCYAKTIWTHEANTKIQLQHQCGDGLEWRRNINTAALVNIVLCNVLLLYFLLGMHTGPANWVFVTLGSLFCAQPRCVCLGYYCNTVEWFWWDWSLSQWPAGFLRCFDAIGWVIWPAKIVPEMTYEVSSGTLSLYTLTLHELCRRC